jgi:hypothetical protein
VRTEREETLDTRLGLGDHRSRDPAAEADPRVLSICLSTGGSIMSSFQILESELDERRMTRRHPNGQLLSRPCVKNETEVLFEVTGVFPRTNLARQLGLVPPNEPIEVEGNAGLGTSFVADLLEAAQPGELPPRIAIDVVNLQFGNQGCVLWFLVPGEYSQTNPAFFNLNGARTFFAIENHELGFTEELAAHAAIIVGPAPIGDVRQSPVPLQFEMPDGALITLEDARVSFLEGPEPAACVGSVTVTVQ